MDKTKRPASLNAGRLKNSYCCELTAVTVETATAAALTTTTIITAAATAAAALTTTAVETATTAAATTATAGGTIFCCVHTKGTTFHFRAIKSFDGSFSLFGLVHRYKSKTLGSPSGEIRYNFNPGNCSVRTEHFTECIFTC